MRDDITKEILLKKYNQPRLSLEQIAQDLNCSRSLIYKKLEEFGIENSRKHTRMPDDLTGQIIGHLKIIKFNGLRTYSKRNNHEWECECLLCGDKVYKITTEIKRTKFPACFKCQIHHNYQLKGMAHEGISKSLLTRIRRSSLRKSKVLDFDITAKYLWELWIKQDKKCALTNMILSLPKSYNDMQTCNYTASLDRIDSSKGYIENNVQWVHKIINIMKWKLPQEEFIDWCKKVANFK